MRVLVILAFIAALLAGNNRAFAQSGGDWVEVCEENAEGVICQAWSVTGGDMLERVYGCTGASGGGLLVCSGRTLCEVAGLVTVRGADDPCQAEAERAEREAAATAAAEADAALSEGSFDPEDFGEPEGAAPSASASFPEEPEAARAASDAPGGGRGGGGGREAEACWVSDPEDSAVNVRATPNGEIINRLRNGREVEVSGTRDDDRGRAWMMVEGTYQGERRRWGYVFGPLVRCSDDGRTASASASAEAPSSSPKPQSSSGPQCLLRDEEEGGVNVRATPNGEIVNRLRNGRVVTMTGASLDDEGRPWLLVESAHEGRWRKWGYVFGEIATCR